MSSELDKARERLKLAMAGMRSAETPVEPAHPSPPDPADDEARRMRHAEERAFHAGGEKAIRQICDAAAAKDRLDDVARVASQDQRDACERIAALETSLAEARKALAEALKWDGDLQLPEDEAIHAAHPTRSGSHETYAEAIRMVTAKRSKGALVDLVNWLLVRDLEDRARREALVKGLELQVQSRDTSIHRLLGQLGRAP